MCCGGGQLGNLSMCFTDGVDKPKLVASLLQVRITSAGSEVGLGGGGRCKVGIVGVLAQGRKSRAYLLAGSQGADRLLPFLRKPERKRSGETVRNSQSVPCNPACWRIPAACMRGALPLRAPQLIMPHSLDPLPRPSLPPST